MSCLLIVVMQVFALLSTEAINVKAKFITMDDGLVNNTVRYIYQDSKGFIWFATINGLSRYDGHNFKTIVPHNNAKITLADRRVFSLKEDKHGLLWIKMTPNVISCYDLKAERFIDYTGCGEYLTHYRDIAFLNNGTWLWGEEGCRRIMYDGGKLTSDNFTKANGSLIDSKVRRVVETEIGIWILQSKGLHLWKKGKLHLIDSARSYMWVTSINGKTFLAATDGSLWIYDGAKGMKRIAKISGVDGGYDLPGQLIVGDRWYLFTTHGGYVLHTRQLRLERVVGALDIKNATVLTDNKGDFYIYNKTGVLRYVDRHTGRVKTFNLMTPQKVKTLDTERYHIIQARNGITWITTNGGGLYAYDVRKGLLHHYSADDMGQEIVPTNSQLCIAEDKTGNIWLGTWQFGAVRLSVTDTPAYDTPLKEAPNKIVGHVRMAYVDSSGVWLANTSGMLYQTDGAARRVVSATDEGTNIYSACHDTEGKLWLGSRTKGLFVDGKWYCNDKQNSSSLSYNAVFAIQRDRKGRMWVGTFGGGVNLAIPDGKGGYRFKAFLNDTYGLRSVRCMSIDRNGWLWVGTSEGLVVFDPDRLIRVSKDYKLYNWNNHKLRSNEVRSLFCDRNGNVWVAETGSGFAVCKPGSDYSKLQFKHYDRGNGLVNGMVQAFAEDRQGRIWISTDYGLSCFIRQGETFRNFLFSSSMAGNTYSENCAATLKDGRLLFGTYDGVTVINPMLIDRKAERSTITLTDMSINGMHMETGDPDYPLKKALPYATEINLKHNQNSFCIYFSTLEFMHGSKTLYSYKLDKYDKNWSEASQLNFAAYKKLPPGTYYLHVRATDSNGMWSKNETGIKITIAPPLWATPWAFFIYVILIAGVVYFVTRILRKMNALRTQVKVEEQLAEYKLTFFTNVSHEFRTPLTLIQASMERLEQSQHNSTERSAAIDMMRKSVSRLLRLINELLEFHKAEKGKLMLQLENTDVIPLLKGYFDMFKETAASKRMTYSFEPETQSYKMPVDCGKLDKIIFNLLSNAFKYTPAGGTVILSVAVDKENNCLVIRVKDSGVGIPSERRSKLFTRFASGNVSHNSIGIGLHLVYELVNIHKGTINYEENLPEGSVFIVKLPADNSRYTVEEYLQVPEKVLDNEQDTVDQETKLSQTNVVANVFMQDGVVKGMEPMNDRVILVIEDDDDVRALLVEELSPYATIVAKSDGSSGYEYARSNDIDLILCDVMMPGMNGFELTKRLKEDFDTSHIPIILLTALSAENSKLKGTQCGADAYITKPFSKQLLLTSIFKLIEQREKLKEKFSNDISRTRTFVSVTDSDKAFADRLADVVNENLSNPDFTVDDFAEALSLGHTIMYRKVKGVTGYAPKTYLRIMRMKKAAELLLRPEVNVSEVAYAVGMSDPLYFSKCFKQQFGVSPSTYKKNRGVNVVDK